MGTPLKSLSVLLSPRVLSPLSPQSPKLLSATKKFENFIKVPKRLLTERETVTNVVKRLEFSEHSSAKNIIQSVHVKVTDYEDDIETVKDVLINTPNKKNISENGIEGTKIHNILGVGSFGKVVRGIHKGEIVAVKVVKNAFALGEKNALNLNHINIVRTLDIIQKQEGSYSLIIMEYFSNSKQLQTLLEEHEYKIEDKVIPFAEDICCALDYIHKKGVLHLDLKPQNILVTNNVCKICDFGNSVLTSERKKFNHQGTAVYTAPELLKGEQPDEKCDVYSFGVLLWQLKSRKHPYGDMDNVETVIYKVVKCNWRPENEIPGDDFSKLYHKCWDWNPNKRPLVRDILSELEKML